jgi:hypothetical protein
LEYAASVKTSAQKNSMPPLTGGNSLFELLPGLIFWATIQLKLMLMG